MCIIILGMFLLLLFAIARYARHYMANRTSSLRDHGKKYREIQVHSGRSRPSDRWGGEGGGAVSNKIFYGLLNLRLV